MVRFECYDADDILLSSTENYFKYTLPNVCHSGAWETMYKDTDLKNWKINPLVLNSTVVTCCDYYQRTVGYIFTDCDHDIYSLMLDNKSSGSIHEHYKNMTHEFEKVDWDWFKL